MRLWVLRIADRLGIQQFEQHRTHWAIKDGDIPAELIATSTAERAQRTVAVVAAEYVEARTRTGLHLRARSETCLSQDHARERASRPNFVHQQRRDFLQPAQCFRAREADSLGLGAALFLEPVNG
ncbi:hypothetical protein NKH82_29390 [Mesorhizobium sp. M0915]|uniref:hypothetical protein n=1 Tax=Mesorhizobium sp. M0915 TaxID=2957027 RepID=UPI0033360213